MELLDFAIKNEQDARSFYLDSAKTVQDQAAARMLSLLAEDEKRHELMLTNMKASKVAYVPGDAFAQIRNIYAELRDAPRPLMNKNDHLADILKKAVTIEHEGAKLYAKMAGQTDDPAIASVLERLEKEELKHEKLVQLTLEYVDEPATVLENAEFLWYGHDDMP